MARDRYVGLVRAALSHMHDLPYLQTHALDGLRGKVLQRRLRDALETLGGGRRSELLRLRYGEALDSASVSARLGISQGEYYREHAEGLHAVASMLRADPELRLPPAVSPNTPAALPRHVTAFVGRENELDDLAVLLADTALVTLVGPGGAGKTRLALEAAARVAPSFPDGVRLVELASLAEPSLVPPAAALALGLNAKADADLAATIGRALAGRRLLLLIDNCEHVLEAAAALVGQVLSLEGTDHLRVLATSRRPLGLYGEREFPVGPMPEDDAIRLFVERVRLVRPRFAPDADEGGAIATLCRRLDRLPLALELAAARAKLLPPRALLARLLDAEPSTALDLLGGGPRDAHPRQRGLRDTIDWSYRLLAAEQQQLYRRLAVFDGGFTPEAAAAVSGSPVSELWSSLGVLLDASLVAAEEHPLDGVRVHMLETVREHAREQLVASGQLESAAAAHAAYVITFAEERWTILPVGDAGLPRGALRREVDNVRAALRWLIAREDAQGALRLIGAAAAIWDGWSALEGLDWLRRALALPGAEARTAARARALGAYALLGRYGPGFQLVRPRLEEALEIAAESGDRRTLEMWLHLHMAYLLGILHHTHVQGSAHDHAVTANTIAVELDDRLGQAVAHLFLARGPFATLDYAAAQQHYERALAFADGHHGIVQTVMSQLGHIAHGRGDLAGALALFERSLVLAREEDDAVRIAIQLHNVGLLASDAGDQVAARTHLRESLRLHAQNRFLIGAGYTIDALAGVAAAEGKAEQALRLVGASQALRGQAGHGGTTGGYWAHDAARLARRIAPARQALSPADADAALAAGRALGEASAIAEALAV